MNNTGRVDSRWLPAGSLLLASLYLLLLLSTVQPRVFFSGDGGLKWLVLQQTGTPATYTSLQLPADSTVSRIWQQGFYPLNPPFVYQNGAKRIVSFPPYFQMLNAPLLKLFGYRGLYIIPALSLVILWLLFCWLLRRLHVSGITTALVLLFLAYCSPLTFYASVYWEHTLAVLLLFGGVVFLLMPTRRRVPAAVLGSMAGLASWLRPEALLLCLLFAAVVIYRQRTAGNRGTKYFVAAQLAMILLFFFCNWLLYGSFLGAHGYQLISNATMLQRISDSLVLLIHLNAKWLMFFPLTLLVFAAYIYTYTKKISVPRGVRPLLLISLLFLLTIPFFLPNAGGKQWGPRYFLVLTPLLLMAAALLLPAIQNAAPIWRWLALPLILYSFYLNTWRAYITLHDDYAYRVKPCLDWVQKSSSKTVVVQNQFIAQEFAILFLSKNVFLAEDKQQFARLSAMLQSAGTGKIIFIAKDQEHLVPPGLKNTQGSIQHLGDYYLMQYSLPR